MAATARFAVVLGMRSLSYLAVLTLSACTWISAAEHDVQLDPDGDGTPGVDRLYIDGTLTIGGDYDSKDNGFRQRADQLNRLILGNAADPNIDDVARQDLTGSNGTFDEFRIYDRALSSSDVAELYNYVPEPATIGLIMFGLSFLRRRQ